MTFSSEVRRSLLGSSVRYYSNPEKSQVSNELATGDPEFWTPKPPAPIRVARKKSGKNKPTQYLRVAYPAVDAKIHSRDRELASGARNAAADAISSEQPIFPAGISR
jgi:hypothetical protein